MKLHMYWAGTACQNKKENLKKRQLKVLFRILLCRQNFTT